MPRSQERAIFAVLIISLGVTLWLATKKDKEPEPTRYIPPVVSSSPPLMSPPTTPPVSSAPQVFNVNKEDDKKFSDLEKRMEDLEKKVNASLSNWMSIQPDWAVKEFSTLKKNDDAQYDWMRTVDQRLKVFENRRNGNDYDFSGRGRF
jgi:hypothetical protein